MAQKFLCVYHDQIPAWEALTDSERGRLLMSALRYSATGAPPELSGNERYQWPLIRAQIDRDKASYADKVEKCSKAGRTSVNRRQQTLTDVNGRQRTLTNTIQEEDNTIQDNTRQDNTSPSEEPAAKPQKRKGDLFADFVEQNADSDQELLNALRDFEAFRTKVKRPLTDEAKKRILHRLVAEFPVHEWISVLNQSVDKGWLDLYPPKADRNKPSAIPHDQNPVPSPERIRDRVNSI